MKVIFVHIPKTAGNSIADAYNGNGIIMWGHNMKTPGYKRFPVSSIAVNSKRFRPITKYFLTSFCIVRNPWARTFSAYNYLKKGGLSVDDASDFEKYLSPFKDFNDFVINGLQDVVNKQVHFRPQTFWVVNDQGALMVDKVLKLENIDSELTRFMKGIGIQPVELPKLNTSQKEDYRSAYSEQAIEQVAKIYADDIDRFGYTF